MYLEHFLNNEIPEDVDINRIFDEILELDFIHRDKSITAVAKKLGVSKTELKKQFNFFIRQKSAEQRQNFFQTTFIEKYKDLFDYTDFILPDGFYLQDGYLVYESEKQGSFVLCNFFIVYERIIAKNKAFFRMIDTKGKKSLASGRDLIKSDRLALFFADQGDIYDSKKANLITSFISEFLRLNEDIIRETKGLVETGWHDGKYYLPQIRQVEWLDNLPYSKIEKRFKTKGELTGQIEMLKELAKGKAFVVSLFSLASTLNNLIDSVKMNYICHIGGLRGEGKSFVAKTAVSLFGVPDITVYGQNWNTTSNGVEAYLETMKDVLAWIDEMENATKNNDVISVMYGYSEGAGRTRAYTKDGEVLQRDLKTFRGNMITTGEKGIDEVINSVASYRNKPLGITRRVLDLNVRGLWDGIDKEKVGDLLDKNYGLFIGYWIDYVEKNINLINEIFEYFKNEIKIRLDGKENLYFSLLTVLSLLQNLGVIDDEDYNRQYNIIVEMLEDEKELMEKTKDIKMQFIEILENFIVQNENRFYYDDVNNAEHNDMVARLGAYGKIDDKKVYILKTIFNELCDKYGFVKKQVIEELYFSNMLICNKGRKDKKEKIGDSQSYVYAINLNNIEKETTNKRVIKVEIQDKNGCVKKEIEQEIEEIPF